MPKAAPEDHRPARAVLHAPYPLPFIITRPPIPHSASAPIIGHPSNSPALSAPILPSTSSAHVRVGSTSASISDFPLFKHDWKKAIEPAFPPIPYPLVSKEDRRRKRSKKLHILKLKKEKHEIEEPSEWEINSYISEKLNKDQKDILGLSRQVGRISADGELDEDDPNQDENNLLIYTFISSYNPNDLELSPSNSPEEPITPTQANFPPQHITQEPSIQDDPHRPLDAEPTFDREERHEPPARAPTPFPDFEGFSKATKAEGPAWDVVSDAVSSFWSDGTDADEADQESGIRGSSLTPKLVTPSASASRLLRNFKKRGHSPTDRPLFLGQTNQVPFTFIPPPKKAPSQSSFGGSSRAFGDGGGYLSEATSVRTIRQIPRSKVNRMRVKERDKQAARERSSTPRQVDYQRSAITPQQPTQVLPTTSAIPQNGINGFNFPANPHISTINTIAGASIPQQSMFGLDSFIFAPIAPLLRTSEVLSSPTSGEGIPPSAPQNYQVPGEVGGSRREPSWSPQPMSVDPRTTETQLLAGGVSWPHALPDREQVTPSNSSSFFQAAAGEISSDGDVPMPTALSRITANRGLFDAQKKVSRKDFVNNNEVVPLGKACHNYLHLRKMMSAKKRKDKFGSATAATGGIGKHRRLKEMINEDRNTRFINNSNNEPNNIGSTPAQKQTSPIPNPNLNPALNPGLAQPQFQQYGTPGSQQQWAPHSPWNFGIPNDPNIQIQAQAQAQQLFANMVMQFAQQQASQQLPQGQLGVPPYSIGMPLGFYPQFGSQPSQFTPPWGFGLPQQNNQINPGQQTQQNMQNSGFSGQQTQTPFVFKPNVNASSNIIPQVQHNSFRFPTPGPSPQAPTNTYYGGFAAFTPKSPGDEEHKPPKKRMRSISPSSAHDLMLRRTKSPSAKPKLNIGFNIPQPAGLMSPAQIHSPDQWRTKVKKTEVGIVVDDEDKAMKIEQSESDEEEERKDWSKLVFDIGLGVIKNQNKDGEEDDDDEMLNKFERRNQWVKEERERLRVGNLGLGRSEMKKDRKGKGKEVNH